MNWARNFSRNHDTFEVSKMRFRIAACARKEDHCIVRFVTTMCLSRDPRGSGILSRIVSRKCLMRAPHESWQYISHQPKLARHRKSSLEVPWNARSRRRGGRSRNQHLYVCLHVSWRTMYICTCIHPEIGDITRTWWNCNCACAHFSWIHPNDNPSDAECAFSSRNSRRETRQASK